MTTSGVEPSGDPWMRAGHAIGRFVVRYRWAVILLSVLLTGGLFAASSRLIVDNGPDAMLESNSEASQRLNELRKHFGEDEVALALVTGDVFTSGYLRRLRDLHHDLEQIDLELESLGQTRVQAVEPGTDDQPQSADAVGFGMEDGQGWGSEVGGIFEDVTSLVNVRRTRWSEDRVRIHGLLEDGIPEGDGLAQLRDEVLRDPTLVGQVVGQSGQHSVIVMRIAAVSDADSVKVIDAVSRIAKEHEAEGFTVQVAGLPALSASLAAMMEENLGRVFMLAILIMTGILALTFRSLIGVAGPLLVVIQATIGTMGAMALAGAPLTMLGTILPTFLICVGICDAVHVQTIYRDALTRHSEPKDAVLEALATTLRPVAFTSVTTAVGLAGLCFAQLPAVQSLGLFGGFGVMLALLHSIAFLPAFLSFSRGKGFANTSKVSLFNVVDKLLGVCLRASGSTGTSPRRAMRVIALLVATTLALGVGMLRLETRHDTLSWFPETYPVRVAYDDVDRHVGGTSDIALVIQTGEENGLKDRGLLLGLQDLEKHVRHYRDAEGIPLVGNAVSVLDPVRETWRAVHEGDPAAYAVPDDARGVTDMFTLFETSAPDDLRQLATVDMSTALMRYRVRWKDATLYAGLLDHIQAGIQRYVPAEVEVFVTGSFYNSLSVVQNVLGDLSASFSVAFVGIALLLLVLLRNPTLGSVAVASNLLPIVWVLGIMGWVGIPLTIGNLLIASIGLGIAVDDTIHFVHRFRHEHEAGYDVRAALARTFIASGRAIVISSITLLIGFGVFMTASMQNIFHFGLLVSMVVIAALLIDLLLVPAMLIVAYRSEVERNTVNEEEAHAVRI